MRSFLAFPINNSQKTRWRRVSALFHSVRPICSIFTSWRYKQLTGYWQYSPFSSWQFSNNAFRTALPGMLIRADHQICSAAKFHILDSTVESIYWIPRRRLSLYSEKHLAMASTFYICGA